MKKKSFNFLISCLLTYAMTTSAFASVTIIGTRVIYPASEKEVTVRLDNRGDQPALVQAWIDNGNPNEAVDKINVPFVLLPPVFRMEANKGQTLRIVFTGANLPANKESIFWLNVLDIPPRDKSLANQNQLQMAIRSRIKLFIVQLSSITRRPIKLRQVLCGVMAQNLTLCLQLTIRLFTLTFHKLMQKIVWVIN